MEHEKHEPPTERLFCRLAGLHFLVSEEREPVYAVPPAGPHDGDGRVDEAAVEPLVLDEVEKCRSACRDRQHPKGCICPPRFVTQQACELAQQRRAPFSRMSCEVPSPSGLGLGLSYYSSVCSSNCSKGLTKIIPQKSLCYKRVDPCYVFCYD